METSAAAADAAAGGAHLPICISSDDEEDDGGDLLCLGSYSSDEIQIQQALLLSLVGSSGGAAASATTAAEEPSTLPDRKGKRKVPSAEGPRPRRDAAEDDAPSESTSRRRRRFTCIICMEKVEASEEFLVGACAHAFCAGCIGGYVAAKVSENVAVIGCPDPGCEEGSVEVEACRGIVPPELLDRWGVSLCELALGEKKCYCPFKDCSALLINDDGGGRAAQMAEAACPHCHRVFCARCRAPWHEGIGCGDGENREEDLAFRALAGKEKWQRCPSCRMYVEKSEGYLFIRCRCGCCFCYSCASPMSKEGSHYCKKCYAIDDDNGYVGQALLFTNLMGHYDLKRRINKERWQMS
ncbi:E3 ubiquitin-protein ligase RNF144A-like [Oryza brachyantha]|uniref:RBR-type E3 ubiquitin transferase n=1 Tax=Oryza brachyantha TaxID=4533 RepID=J3MXH9_ORYBR|nr:E3 ubiquitin-protein ligase RNF144A-like [Oryza brachyantha]